jgi:hypothetical protein
VDGVLLQADPLTGRLPIGTGLTEWESATSGRSRLEPVLLNFPQAVLEVTALAVIRDQFQCT